MFDIGRNVWISSHARFNRSPGIAALQPSNIYADWVYGVVNPLSVYLSLKLSIVRLDLVFLVHFSWGAQRGRAYEQVGPCDVSEVIWSFRLLYRVDIHPGKLQMYQGPNQAEQISGDPKEAPLQ